MNLLEYPGVIVGFRPESFLPAEIAPPGAQTRFRFKVNYLEYLGAERLLYGSIEGGPVEGSRYGSKEIIARLSWTMPAGFEAGAVYDFAVAEGDLRFFDSRTEKRIPPRPGPWQ
jgi:multiple sugar transport system ATP-binding protein